MVHIIASFLYGFELKVVTLMYTSFPDLTFSYNVYICEKIQKKMSKISSRWLFKDLLTTVKPAQTTNSIRQPLV